MKNIFKIVIAGALCAVPSIAQACSCAPPPAPKIALEQAAAVFVGRVTSVEKLQTGSQYTSSNRFQFTVSKKWKGVQGAVATVISNGNSAACGIVFDSDRDYLVYAFKNKDDDQLQTNLCTRTKRVADAAADLAELGEPMKEAPDYPVADNGVKQLNVTTTSDPLSALGKALKADGNSQIFRVNWKSPTKVRFNGTALYNRKNSTLKAYSLLDSGSQINVTSVVYSGVTDEILQRLASTEKIEDFFRTYSKYGVTKKDMGSKTVRVN